MVLFQKRTSGWNRSFKTLCNKVFRKINYRRLCFRGRGRKKHTISTK